MRLETNLVEIGSEPATLLVFSDLARCSGFHNLR